jgi:hypothetical protein
VISFHPFIDGAVVLNWVKFSILLLNEEKVSSVGAPGLMDGPPL